MRVAKISKKAMEHLLKEVNETIELLRQYEDTHNMADFEAAYKIAAAIETMSDVHMLLRMALFPPDAALIQFYEESDDLPF